MTVARLIRQAGLTLAALTACATTWAQSFELAPLPYPHNALVPVIDEQTMQIHHGRHHKAYVDNLNAAIAKDSALQGKTLEALFGGMSQLPVAVRNNGGGHWNHTFFWQSMTRPGQGGTPSAALQAAITRDFGSLDALKAAFKTAGLGRFGSGWAWLIVGADGKLKITSTANQDNPLMDLAADRGTPLLGNDVWEHAYYLQYQNRRGDYLDAWWQIVDWNVISNRYAAATASTAR
jgi:Fe-Mn family superoxide dismutase